MKLDKLLCGIPTGSPIPDLEITDIYYDSRKVKPGSLFICLNGLEYDGHDFAVSAEQNGAVCILAEHQTDSKLAHIIVDDTREIMSALCSNFFGNPEKKLKFIGVTGTNGKSSTVFFIKTMLDALGKKTGMIGTVVNKIGDKCIESHNTTPEPYELMSMLSQMVKAGMEYVVMEVSSHSMAFKRVNCIQFETAVFTNLTQDHLDFHKTMENYKSAKAKLFMQSKTAVFNIDNDIGREFFEAYENKKYSYSTIYNYADYVAKEVNINEKGVKFLSVTMGGIARTYVDSPGIFAVYNVLAAIGAVCAQGVQFTDLIPILKDMHGIEGRAQIVKADRPYTVMIDYAHTPDGLENILSSIKEYSKGRIVTVFGCGGNRDRAKRPIMGEIASRYSDFVIVTSDNPRTENPMDIINEIVPGVKKHVIKCRVIENRREAIKYAIENALPDDIILLAGKGHEKYQIIGTEKREFDEEKTVLEIMEETGK